MRNFISILLLMLSLESDAVNNYSSEELLKAQEQGVVIIDIRTPQEWLAQGIIPNAKRIMFFDQNRKPVVNKFLTEFQKIVISKDQEFILVCRSGTRTGAATRFLEEKMGYKNAGHLEKGMVQWLMENRTIEKIK